MSTLTGLIGGSIKTVQRGSVSLSDYTTRTVTISSVDTSKSFVVFSMSGLVADQTAWIRGYLNSSTELVFTRYSSSSNSCTVAWEVVEYE